MSNLIPFCCPGLYHVTKDERKDNHLEPKARLCRFLGYDDSSKSAIVHDIGSNKIVKRHDCIFDQRLVQKACDSDAFKGIVVEKYSDQVQSDIFEENKSHSSNE